MEDEFLRLAEQIIKMQLERQKNSNLDDLLNKYINQIDNTKLTLDDKIIIRTNIIEDREFEYYRDKAVIETASIIVDHTNHIPWYNDWVVNNSENKYYWNRLENYLRVKLTKKYRGERAGEIVKSIDDSSNVIMDNIENPTRKKFSSKGLVVGYVQSGKTANFTALIAKAADSGYRFVVVLAGIHDILRLQTQLRLDKELTGINDRNLNKRDFITMPASNFMWQRLTTAEGSLRGGEFIKKGKDPFVVFCHKTGPMIAIIKKNCSVMDNLISWVRNSDENIRKKIPLLLIDDEADQASINTKSNKELSETNKRIRKIINLFSRVSYIGYTATPFANVLIDAKEQDDLYPRNFIISLPKPKGYFGASQLFDSNLTNCFINVVPEKEIQQLLPQRRSPLVKIPNSLYGAIYDFLISCCIRCFRGEGDESMSMLIHIKHTILHQGKIKTEVDDIIKNIIFENHSKSGKKKLLTRFEQYWNEFKLCSEQIIDKLHLSSNLPTFPQLIKHLENVLGQLQVLELNNKSEDKLDYTLSPKPKVIAIGGNQLSRGLTLEGLMGSYYLRNAKQYDTLLQMGRWFGYRENYEDLTRIYTSASIKGYYIHLATIEEEIRKEIYRYEEEKLTPREMAIVIKSHPNLKVTSKNKMGAGVERQSSFSGKTQQTFYMPLDNIQKLKYNLNIGKKFVEKLTQLKNPLPLPKNGFIWKNVEPDFVIENFIDKYSHSKDANSYGSGFDHDAVLKYIRRRISDRELLTWNIALISRKGEGSAVDASIDFAGYKIVKINRSRYKNDANGYNIGVLSSSSDLTIDIGTTKRNSQTPLLLLYVISKNSGSNVNTSKRVPLFSGLKEKEDVLGFVIKFPESAKEPLNFIGQVI